MSCRRRPSNAAFTLVELIAAMVVIGIIGSFGALTIQRAAAVNTQVASRAMLYAEASSVMDRLVRKVQSTPVRSASNPAVPSVASFSATGMTWDDASSLSYSAASQTITFIDAAAGDSAAAAAPVLADSITAFAMTAYDESNTDILAALGVSSLNSTQGATVRRVAIQFTLTRRGESVTLRSRAFTRCTMVKVGP